MSKIKSFILKHNKSFLFRFFFVFTFSLLFGIATVRIGRSLPIFKSDKSQSEFLMNRYFTRLTEKTYQSEYDNADSIYLLEAYDLNRVEFADMIANLDSFHPKVIGLDFAHQQLECQEGDSMLVGSLKNCSTDLVIPVFVDEKGTIVTPFYKDSLPNAKLGSVNFDMPWYNKTKHGDYYTFAYQIAKTYCGRSLDTTSFLVDYEPISLYQRIKYNALNHAFYYDTLGSFEHNQDNPAIHGEKLDLAGSIVLIGTLDRFVDPIRLDFPVVYEDNIQSVMIPGMVALSYQIRAFLNQDHQIKKMNGIRNSLCIIGLVIYILFCFFLACCDKKCEDQQNLFEKFVFFNLPWIKVVALIIAEYLLIIIYCDIVKSIHQMPDIWFVMAALPYVNCFDIVYSRLLNILENTEKSKKIVNKNENNDE